MARRFPSIDVATAGTGRRRDFQQESPLPTRRPRYLTRIIACAVGALALALPSAASANKSTCTYPSTSQVFAQWGDPNYYYLASGGAMESLKDLWSSSGQASLLSGNEPWFLANAGHTKALRLASGASVTSGRFCVSAELPHLRLVAKGGGGELEARVDTYDANGKLASSHTVRLYPEHHLAWAPSRFISLETSHMAPGTTANASVTLTSVGGEWLVDDVFIDPYAR